MLRFRNRVLVPMLLAMAQLAAPGSAVAQIPPPLELPSERPPEIPLPEPPAPADALEAAPEAVPAPILPELSVFVRAVRITGNTVISGDLLSNIARPYTGRALSAADIEDLAEQITRQYTERGYLTSGATIPDQDFQAGVLHVLVVEGRIGELRFEGNDRLRRSALRRAILPDPDAPLNVDRLEERLRRLQERPDVEGVHAELRPGMAVGEALLVVRVEERLPIQLTADLSNDRAPALGQAFGAFWAALSSPTGHLDDLSIGAQFGSGLQDVQGLYRILFHRGIELSLRSRYSDSQVVEAPFDALDIQSDYLTAGFDLNGPLWQRGFDDVRLGLRGEWRRSRSTLGGVGFSFSEGADRGTSQVTVLRPYLFWLRRQPNQVIAVRLQGSFGIDALGATNVPGRFENGEFVSGLVQAQFARRFDSLRRSELVVRLDAQLANQPLLSIERFSVGGHASVRGYRDNTLVRDNGYALSFELRVPVVSRPNGSPILQVAPFFDVGRAWDKTSRPDNQGDTLIGVGAGLRWRPWDWLDGDLYYGYGTNDAFARTGGSAQGVGVYFRLTASTF